MGRVFFADSYNCSAQRGVWAECFNITEFPAASDGIIELTDVK